MGQQPFFKETPKGVIIKIKVTPGAKSFKIEGTDAWTNELKIRLKSQPQGGKANLELTTHLSKLLSSQVAIITGHKSSRKTLLIESRDCEKVIKKLIG